METERAEGKIESNLAGLIEKYNSRYTLPRLVERGCEIIQSHAVSGLELRKCKILEGLVRNVSLFREPTGRDFGNIEDQFGNEIKYLMDINPEIAEMYSELYQKVCDLNFSGYVARVEEEIELDPGFEKKRFRKSRDDNSILNIACFKAPDVNFGAERRYGRRRKR